MEKLNKLFAIAQRADAVGNLIDGANPHDIIDIAEAFLALERRAMAAEAQLDELAKQKPYVWFGTVSLNVYSDHDGYDSRIPLFTRPAPAVSLADMQEKLDSAETMVERLSASQGDIYENGRKAGANEAIATILRNIEEAQ